MTTEQLVEQFAKKPGLPYLLSTKPLRKTVAKMVDESGYTYWDTEIETAYWDGDTDDDPENWRKRTPFADSPDVRTSINDTDVKIGNDYVVYTDIEALLDVHHDPIRPPEAAEVECAEDGCTTMVEPSGDDPPYCEEHQKTPPEKTPCQSCGEKYDESELNAQGICSDCTQPPDWDTATSQMAASRAFNEVRTHALSKTVSDGTPGVSQVTVEVMGEDRLSKGSFIAQRDGFTNRSDAVSVRMSYDVKTSTGTSYSASYQGSLDDFSRVTNQPDPFGESVNVTLKFRVDIDKPEPITDSEDDLLAELKAGLGQTNIDVKVQARGPAEVPSEATQ
jgi:hypothetical protein